MENTSPEGNQKSRALESHFHQALRRRLGMEIFGLLPALGSCMFPTDCNITYLGLVESFLPLLVPYTEGMHSIYGVHERQGAVSHLQTSL